MTEKQKIFADEYLIDLNATRAYRVAYPSVKKEEAAAVNGSKLLRNTKVIFPSGISLSDKGESACKGQMVRGLDPAEWTCIRLCPGSI